MTKKIPLTQGKFALVDDEDYEFLMQWKWRYDGRYASRNERLGKKQRTVRMHVLINRTPAGLHTDHVSMDRLDNRKQNLRSATRTENLRNINAHINSVSQYKGVSWDKTNDKWKSRANLNGKEYFLGRFHSEVDAAKAYNEFAVIHFGAFARLNDIDQAATPSA